MITAIDTESARSAVRNLNSSVKKVNTYDAVIIGNSVSGAALASILGEAGMSIAVVADKQGGQRRWAETAFSVSKLPDCPVLCGAEQSMGASLKVVSLGGKALNVLRDGDPLSFFSIPQIETYFTAKAMRAKVRVYSGGAITLSQENGCWVVSTANNTLKGRIVVGTGGWDSIVRKAASVHFDQKDLYFASGCTACMEGENGVKISLLENGRFCRIINYGSKASVAVLGPSADIITPRLTFEKIMKSDLAPISSVISYWTAFVPSPASAQFYSTPCAGKNWILLGEAAGHIHPISGDGLRYALRGAQLAAQAIECGEPRIFDGLWRDDYGRELETAVKLRNQMNKWRLSTELVFSAASKSLYLKNVISNKFFRGKLNA